MNIVWATSESSPFAKTGGLADVSAALPATLAERGHCVSVIMPYYPQQTGKLKLSFTRIHDAIGIPLGNRTAWCRVYELELKKDLTYFFIEYNTFFDRPKLYDWNGQEYSDNACRYAFLSRAVMELCVQFSLKPDILHANDWHTALCCVYLKSPLYREQLKNCRSVMTIHNIGYQGNFDKGNLYWTGLGWEYFNYMCLEFYDRLNFLKGGIMTADMVSTVSPTYAFEILSNEYSFGLDGALFHRACEGRLRGILNGIDVETWDPEHDRLLPAHFSAEDLSGKEICKTELRKRFHLPVRKNVPLFSVISRLAYQKGLDVFNFGLEELLRTEDYQYVVITSGEKAVEDHFKYLAWKYPEKLALFTGFADDETTHLAEAGADMFIMPSRYEPCGLNQMYSMRCGTLPVVRHTGGLADTVINCGERNPAATGFVLWDLNAKSLNDTLRWAASVWKNDPEQIRRMRVNGMKKDFSWNRTAQEYENMYHDAHK